MTPARDPKQYKLNNSAFFYVFFLIFGVREYYHWIRLEILYNLPLKIARELLRQSCLGFQLYILLLC